MYQLIEFPEIQKFQELEGFEANSCLANDQKFLNINDVSDSAYFVNVEWMMKSLAKQDQGRDEIHNREVNMKIVT